MIGYLSGKVEKFMKRKKFYNIINTWKLLDFLLLCDICNQLLSISNNVFFCWQFNNYRVNDC